MTLLDRRDFSRGSLSPCLRWATENEDGGTPFGLHFNWDTPSYGLGDGYWPTIAIGVEGLHRHLRAIATKGGKVVRPPGPMEARRL